MRKREKWGALDARLAAIRPIDGVPMTLREVADLAGTSFQRIEQIERSALAKLRQRLEQNPELLDELLSNLG